MSTPVSGPGPFSKRTDMGQKRYDIPNADYGEQKSYQQLQAGAPMAAQGGLPPGTDFNSLFGNAADRIIPLNAESNQPNTPVTDGAELGAGAGLDVLGLSNPDDETKAKLAAWLPALEYLANQPGSSTAARNAIRRAKAGL